MFLKTSYISCPIGKLDYGDRRECLHFKILGFCETINEKKKATKIKASRIEAIEFLQY